MSDIDYVRKEKNKVFRHLKNNKYFKILFFPNFVAI